MRSQLHTRRATLALNSFDPAARTFTAIAATDKPILRSDPFDGDFYEVLAMRPGAIRMRRLDTGRTPILDNHRAVSAGEQLGVVTRAAVNNGNLVIDGKLTQADTVTPIAQSIADGVAVNVSVGYRVYRSERTKGADGIPVITRTDWEPIEVSIVPVGADPETYIRNERGRPMPQARRNQRSAPRVEPDAPIEELDDAIETRAGDDIATRSAAESGQGDEPRAMSDRTAQTARTIGRQLGLGDDFVNRSIAEGMSLTEFRAAALDELATQSRQQPGVRQVHTSSATFDNVEFLGRAIEGALYARMTGKAAEGPAVEWRGRSLLEMGVALIEARGERVSWKSRELVASRILERSAGMHTTSDFPVLLQQSGNRVLLDSYQAAQTPLKLLAKQRDALDFRALTAVKLGEAPKLDEVPESGEIRHGTRTEAKESFRLKTFAKIFSISRQAIINDDLGAFADTNMAWGRAAAETEASELVALFTANSGDGATLDDTSPLYSTTRGNKAASGGAISVTTLGAARKAMREFKGLDGKTPISVTPKHLLVGAAKETEAEQVLTALMATQVGEQNPFSGKLTLHVEARLTGNAWRLFADPAELAVLQIAYLNGQAGPILETRLGWETLGAEFRAVLDFGCGLVEWRGTYLNSGN